MDALLIGRKKKLVGHKNFVKISLSQILVMKRKNFNMLTHCPNNMKLYKWQYRDVTFTQEPSFVPPHSSYDYHEKSHDIPAKQMRAGEVSNLSRKQKNRFVISYRFFLRESASVHLRRYSKKWISYNLREKKLIKNLFVPGLLGSP